MSEQDEVKWLQGLRFGDDRAFIEEAIRRLHYCLESVLPKKSSLNLFRNIALAD